MELGLIERGTVLHISPETDQGPADAVFEAVFRYLDLDDESMFIVQCAGMYKEFDKLDHNARLFIHFTQEFNFYSFFSRAIQKRGGSSLILLEQLTAIESYSRRTDARDELRAEVHIHGISEDIAAAGNYKKPESDPDMMEKMFDISTGGFCVVSDSHLNSQLDPYYLAEFTLGEKDHFILPAKLVRRSDYPRSKVGRIDYGFKFILDYVPEETGRLTNAIMRAKVAMRKY